MTASPSFAFDPDYPPHRVTAWVERLRRTLAAAPDGVWLYVAAGTMEVMALGPDGKRVVDSHGSMEQDAVVASIYPPPEMDGGDW